jgi:hypothetical protein
LYSAIRAFISYRRRSHGILVCNAVLACPRKRGVAHDYGLVDRSFALSRVVHGGERALDVDTV